MKPSRFLPSLRLLVLSSALVLGGCTSLQRAAHLYGSKAPPAQTFQYQDGGAGLYYAFNIGEAAPDSLIFFYGATGCPSWKAVMPGYVDGLAAPARIFVLNKRFVADRSTGLFGCSPEFHLANNPDQWVADYSEFIAAQIKAFEPKPRNVVLVGVSEAAMPAARVAARLPEVTHLAIIGSGGYSLRRSLEQLRQRGAINFNVESGWKDMAADPRSIEKSWYGNRYRWWSDVLDLDPLPDLLKLDIPILVGFGEQDESVPVESARFLEAKFKEAGKRNLTLRVYPGADHRLSAGGVSYRSQFFAELGQRLR